MSRVKGWMKREYLIFIGLYLLVLILNYTGAVSYTHLTLPTIA